MITEFKDLSLRPIFETGIKVIDLLCPLVRVAGPVCSKRHVSRAVIIRS
jgi:F0F1-type ATP synthase beta subunit